MVPVPTQEWVTDAEDGYGKVQLCSVGFTG